MRTKRGNADQETGSKHQFVTLCDALYQFYQADTKRDKNSFVGFGFGDQTPTSHEL